MIEKLKKIFWKDEGHEGLKTSKHSKETFILQYGKLVLGLLSIKDGIWNFKYSEEFQLQKEVLPLVDFPDLNKEYSSEQLWPFFASRIPGLSQPSVQEILHKDHIDEHDEVALLKRFGHRTITNPYLLQPAF